MLAVFPHSLASHRRQYEESRYCLRVILCVWNVQGDRAHSQLWNTVCYPFFESKKGETGWYTVKMPWVMKWWENGLESSTDVVITSMTSRGAAGRLWSQAAMFYEKGIQKLVPRYDEWLNNDGNYIQGGSNMTGTNCDLFTHKSSRSYLNHLVKTG